MKVPPNVVPSAVVLRLAISSSTYFFLAASVSSVGVAKPFTLVENKFAYFNPGEPKLKILELVGMILVLTVAPRFMTSPPSPRLIVLPLRMIAPLTVRLFLIDILFA